jgi:hypothetical protein
MSALRLDEMDRRSAGRLGLPERLALVLLVLTGAHIRGQEVRIGPEPAGGDQEKPDRDAARRLEGMRKRYPCGPRWVRATGFLNRDRRPGFADSNPLWFRRYPRSRPDARPANPH